MVQGQKSDLVLATNSNASGCTLNVASKIDFARAISPVVVSPTGQPVEIELKRAILLDPLPRQMVE